MENENNNNSIEIAGTIQEEAAAEQAQQQNGEPERRKGNNSLFLFLLIIAVAAAGLWFFEAQREKKAASLRQTEMPPVVVADMTVERRDVPFTSEYMGQTNGYKQAEVRAQVGGILLRKEYVEGQPVRAGQVLFRIDPAPYRATLNRNIGSMKQAQVQMGLADVEYKRVSALYRKNALSKNDFDNAEANLNVSKAAVEAARAAVRQAQIDLDWTTVRAPISGLSSKEQHSVGNLINTGDKLTQIVQADPVYVDFAIPADEHRYSELLRSKGVLKAAPEGVSVRVALGDGTFYDQKGKIDFQDQFVDAATATMRARAKFNNKDNLLYPGQFVRVYVDGYYAHNIIAVPLRATLETAQGTIVYVLDDKNIPALRQVKVIARIENNCILSEGLTEGERIVTDGVAKVVPGKAVKIAEPETVSGDTQQN